MLCVGKRDTCTAAVTAPTSNTACTAATAVNEICTGTCRITIDNCIITVSE